MRLCLRKLRPRFTLYKAFFFLGGFLGATVRPASGWGGDWHRHSLVGIQTGQNGRGLRGDYRRVTFATKSQPIGPASPEVV